jgi:hypothetical protein
MPLLYPIDEECFLKVMRPYGDRYSEAGLRALHARLSARAGSKGDVRFDPGRVLIEWSEYPDALAYAFAHPSFMDLLPDAAGLPARSRTRHELFLAVQGRAGPAMLEKTWKWLGSLAGLLGSDGGEALAALRDAVRERRAGLGGLDGTEFLEIGPVGFMIGRDIYG